MSIEWRLALCAACIVVYSAVALSAHEWPGLWGPSRNGTTPAVSPLEGKAGVLWRRPVAGGYSEVAVVANRAFTMELHDGADFVVSLDAATGRERWRLRVGPTYRGHDGSDDGPISTPAIGGDDVFALGPHGHLIAADAATGRERWRHDLVKAFGATAPTWGFAASPLIELNLVIVPTGGERSRGLLAFDRHSGRLVWNAAVAKAAGYGSAVSMTLGGVRQVVAVAADVVFGVSPSDGRVLWSAPGPAAQIEVSNSAIALAGDRLLLSNWEESLLLAISRDAQGGLSATERWRTQFLRNSNGPTVYRDGYLYGFAGGFLVCLNVETASVQWRERTGAGTLIAVGNQLLIWNQESGELQMGAISPKSFSPTMRFRAAEPGIRAVTGPSFANGRLFVRNLKEIVALTLR